MLHHAVVAAAKRFQNGRLLAFGNGLNHSDLVVPTLPDQKNRLFDEYLPQWRGRKMYDFALHDEGFVKVDLTDPES